MAPILAQNPAPPPALPPAATAAPNWPAAVTDLLPAIVLALAGLAWLVATTLAGTTATRTTATGGIGSQLLVIGPPALDQGGVSDIVWQAGGAVLGHGGLPNVAIAVSDQPDFARALTAAGAWLVLPSPRLLGCLGKSATVTATVAGTGTGAGRE